MIAALYLASEWPRLWRHVVALSPALWWPGESGQISGQAASDLALRRAGMGVWMITGAAEEPRLLDSNDIFYDRFMKAGRNVTRVTRRGGHELAPADVVDGVTHLLAPERPTPAGRLRPGPISRGPHHVMVHRVRQPAGESKPISTRTLKRQKN